VDPHYRMTTVDLNNFGYRNEPFVLVKHVNQVSYVKDMSTKSKKGKTNDNSSNNEPKHHIVLSGKETLWESRTGPTCQKIMKRMMEFRLSQ
jgi:hypothetical protein